MKKFITSLQLRLSDLFILVGFIPFIFFLMYGQEFMQYPNPDDVAFKLWAIIPCFVISITCWGIYTYLEFKRGNGTHNYVALTFVALAIIGVIGIAIQPNIFQETVVVRFVGDINRELYGEGLQVGDIVNAPLAPLVISTTHYVFFIMDLILILFFIYIGLFIFPKRFTSITFVKYLGYVLFVGLFALVIYSYIAEHANYIPFIKALLGKEGSVYDYTVKSFIIHRNAYGMVMMIGIIFCFINHSIENKWWYYLLAAFFFINMIFSYCKTSILISVVLIAIYVVYRLIVTFKEHKNRNSVILIGAGSVALFAIILVGISYLSKGKYLGFIYSMISDSGTLDNRVYIWDNCFQLLRANPIYFFFGRGFGLINEMLYPMNIANSDKVFPTHSAYVNLIAEGGIFYLFAYLVLLGYSGYVIYKSFKKSPGLTMTISLGALAFTLYSFIETIHYLVYAFLLPVMILYHVLYLEKEQEQ